MKGVRHMAEHADGTVCVKGGPVSDEIDWRLSSFEQWRQEQMRLNERIEERISAHGREIDELQLDNVKTQTLLTQINATVTSTQASVEEIRARRTRWWDTIAGQLVSVIGGVALAALLIWLNLR